MVLKCDIFNTNWFFSVIFHAALPCEIMIKLEWAASNGNRYPPYPQVMATAISQ